MIVFFGHCGSEIIDVEPKEMDKNRKQGNDTNVLYQYRKQVWTKCQVLLLLATWHQLWLSYSLNKGSRMRMDDYHGFAILDSR